jgi:purine-binding chemotaxis protein CheW
VDILAARKKAAERSREQQKQKSPEPAIAEQPAPQVEIPAPEPPIQTPRVAAPEETSTISAPPETSVVAPSPAPAAAASAASGEPKEEPVAAEEMEMLSFRVGDEEYVVNVDDVKEVLKNRELTHVPNAPDYMLGVMALRGPVLPVIDLSKRIGLPAGVRDEKSRILIVTVQDEDAGIVVDRVTGVVKISPDSVRPVPETIEGGSAFLRGIARKGDKLYILLDIEKVLGA